MDNGGNVTMAIQPDRRHEPADLFSKTRQVFPNGDCEYLCLPSAGADILELERGDSVVIHELDDGDLELFSKAVSPSGQRGLIVGESRKIQGRDGHSSLLCNVPKRSSFDAGDLVDVVVYPDRMRIEPAEEAES